MTTLEIRTSANLVHTCQVRTGGWELRYRRAWAALLTATLAFASWAVLAPPVLGGRTSYVITEGVSMLPHFHAGDLAVLRRETNYRVGEVAAYHNGQLHEVVMHRIIGIISGHYVFKGDNNGFVDSFEPTSSEIVGAEWLHVDRAGKLLEKLRDPAVAAGMLGIFALISFSPRRATRHQRRRRGHAH